MGSMYAAIGTIFFRDLFGISVCMLLAGIIAGRQQISEFIDRQKEHINQLPKRDIDGIFAAMFTTALLWFSVMSFVYYEVNDLIAVKGFRITYICSGVAVLLTAYKGLWPSSKMCFKIVFDD